MKMLSAAEFRSNSAKALNLVAYGGQRIVLGRRGKPIAALISIDDLELLRKAENNFDLKAIKREEGFGEEISLEDLETEQSL